MEKKFIFSQTCVIYFLLMWNMSRCQDTYQRCPADINDGYVTTDYLERHCEGLPGDVCDYECNPGFVKVDYKLNCQVDGFWQSVWHPDSKKFCAKVEPGSALIVLRSTDEGNVITIMGITAGSLIGMIVIVVFVVWIAKRSTRRKSQRRVPGQVGHSCLRPREYHVHAVTNIRQQPYTNGIDSVSSVVSPAYDGLYVHSFVPRIPTISSSCKFPELPTLYSATPVAPNESPPTYEEVVTDPSRFNFNI